MVISYLYICCYRSELLKPDTMMTVQLQARAVMQINNSSRNQCALSVSRAALVTAGLTATTGYNNSSSSRHPETMQAGLSRESCGLSLCAKIEMHSQQISYSNRM